MTRHDTWECFNAPPSAQHDDGEEHFYPAHSLLMEADELHHVGMERIGAERYFEPPRDPTHASHPDAKVVRFLSPPPRPRDAKQHCESILEELLPTKMDDGPCRASGSNDGERGSDWMAAWLFWGLLGMTILASVLLLPFSRGREGATLQRAIADSFGWFVLLLMAAGGVAATGAWLLLRHPGPLLQGLTTAIPVSLFATGLVLFHCECAGWTRFVAGGMIAAGIVAAGLLLRARHQLRTTTALIETAAEVIRINPELYWATALLMALQTLLVLGWLGLFVGLLGGGGVGMRSLQVLQLFMLGWTTAVLATLQKFMVGGVVADWHRGRGGETSEPAARKETDDAWTHLRRARAEAFGLVCLAALIVTTARILRLAASFVHRGCRTVGAVLGLGPIARGLQIGVVMAQTAERLLGRFTDFVVLYPASRHVESCSFWQASWSVARILRRNALLVVSTDLLAQLLLGLATGLIAGGAGVLLLLLVSSRLHSPYGWLVGAVYALLIGSVLSFVSTLYTAAIDAVFLCYAVDCDRQQIQCPRTHVVFSAWREDHARKLSAPGLE